MNQIYNIYLKKATLREGGSWILDIVVTDNIKRCRGMIEFQEASMTHRPRRVHGV